jgi:hypothetical protein
MFCPRCGTNQSDDIKFCKTCGGNLSAVRQAVTSRETGGKIDWSKTWVAEMFLSEAERETRKEQLERQRGITPEVKREGTQGRSRYRVRRHRRVDISIRDNAGGYTQSPQPWFGERTLEPSLGRWCDSLLHWVGADNQWAFHWSGQTKASHDRCPGRQYTIAVAPAQRHRAIHSPSF